MNKTLLILGACLLPALGLAKNPLEPISVSRHVPGPAAAREKFVVIMQVSASDVSFSTFHYGESSERIVTISPDALKSLLTILAKFPEWEKAARKNNAQTFAKVIGKLDGQEVYFRWSREDRAADLILPKRAKPESVQAKFREAYISGIQELAKQYPDAKAEVEQLIAYRRIRTV
jgi:hypothetical protein